MLDELEAASTPPPLEDQFYAGKGSNPLGFGGLPFQYHNNNNNDSNILMDPATAAAAAAAAGELGFNNNGDEPNQFWSLPLEHTASNDSIYSSSGYNNSGATSVTPPLSSVDPSAFWTGVDPAMISSPPSSTTMAPSLSMKASNSSLSSMGSNSSVALTPPSEDSFLLHNPSLSPTPVYNHNNPSSSSRSSSSAGMGGLSITSTPYQQHQYPATPATNISTAQPSIPMLPSSPPNEPISFDDEAQNESARILQRHTYTKWVKLSRMTPERVNHIRQLAEEKGIDLDTVEAVLKHYLNPEKRIDNEVNRFCGEDVYIKITMGGGSFSTDDDSDSRSKKRSVDGSSSPPKKKKHRKQKPNYIKRPLNSFMLYRKSQTQSAMAYSLSADLKLNHQNISQIIGLMWQTESKELKDEFAKFAGQEKEIHKALHPDYKFCPQKKKKQSTSSASSSSSTQYTTETTPTPGPTQQQVPAI